MSRRGTVAGVCRLNGKATVEAGNRRSCSRTDGMDEGLQCREDCGMRRHGPCSGRPVIDGSRHCPRHPVRFDGTFRSTPFGSSYPLSLDAGNVKRAADATGRS